MKSFAKTCFVIKEATRHNTYFKESEILYFSPIPTLRPVSVSFEMQFLIDVGDNLYATFFWFPLLLIPRELLHCLTGQ